MNAFTKIDTITKSIAHAKGILQFWLNNHELYAFTQINSFTESVENAAEIL